MKPYTTTPARRKLRGRNQISDRYWLAFRSLYGPNQSAKLALAQDLTRDDLNAEKMQRTLP